MLSVPGTGRGVPACVRLRGVLSARRKETGGLLIKMGFDGFRGMEEGAKTVGVLWKRAVAALVEFLCWSGF